VSSSDLIDLYSQRILALAADMPNARRLENPMGSAQKRSPLCGSTITVDMDVADGKVSRFGMDVKACALGQASASVVSANIVGCTRAQIESARDQLEAMLKQDGPVPASPFDGLEVLLPAREYRNRHASIMLCLNASLEAFDAATA